MATPSLALFPSGRKATKLYSVLPTDGTGDFTVARAGLRNEINSDLKLSLIAANVPAFNYDTLGGCPVLNTEPQATNLITYPVSYGNSYWTKSGASIEGDITIGAEQVTDGDMSNAASWVLGAGASISSGVATLTASGVAVNLRQDTIWASNSFDNKTVRLTYTITANTLNAAGLHTGTYHGDEFYAPAIALPSTVGTHSIDLGVPGIGTANRLTMFISSTSTSGSISFTDVSVKEVQGYSAPSVDFPTSAFKLVGDGTAAFKNITKSGLSVTDTLNYTISVFAKADTLDYLQLLCSGGFAINHQNFDLVNGVIGTGSGVVSADIEAYANGWYKCSVTLLATSTTVTNAYIVLADSASMGRAVGFTTSSGVYLFMAQLEQGSVATSPTFTDITLAAEGSTTTRLADVVTNTGLSSVINSVEGVIEIKLKSIYSSLTGDMFLSLSDNTSSNSVYFDFTGTSVVAQVVAGGVATCTIAYDLTNLSVVKTLKFKYKTNDFGLKVDGVEVGTDVSGATLTAGIMDTIKYSRGDGALPYYGDTDFIKIYSGITSY